MKKTSLIFITLMMVVGSLFAAPKKAVEPEVIFDPATTKVDVGEVVTINGEKYLKIVCDGYNTTFNIPTLDCSGHKNFVAVMFGAEEVKKYNITVKVCDADMGEITTPQVYGVPTEPKTVMIGRAKQEAWGNKLSKSKIAAVIQPYVQDSTQNYAAVKDVTIYIGKIIAK